MPTHPAHRPSIALLTISVLLSLPAPLFAVIRTWNGGPGGFQTSWSDPNNWTPPGISDAGVPGTGFFTQSGGTVIRNAASTPPLAANASSHGSYPPSGGSIGFGHEIIGLAGAAPFAQSAGTNDVETSLILGSSS